MEFKGQEVVKLTANGLYSEDIIVTPRRAKQSFAELKRQKQVELSEVKRSSPGTMREREERKEKIEQLEEQIEEINLLEIVAFLFEEGDYQRDGTLRTWVDDWPWEEREVPAKVIVKVLDKFSQGVVIEEAPRAKDFKYRGRARKVSIEDSSESGIWREAAPSNDTKAAVLEVKVITQHRELSSGKTKRKQIKFQEFIVANSKIHVLVDLTNHS